LSGEQGLKRWSFGCTSGSVARSLTAARLEAFMPQAQYDVVELAIAARPVAGVRARVTRGQIAHEFGRHLDQVYAVARVNSMQLDGQNIFIYRECIDDQLTVDFCVGVTAPFTAVGAVAPLNTPGGRAAMTTHHGDYRGLGAANAAIVAWCRAHGRALAGPSWEVYGHWHADQALLRTEVYHLLQRTEGATGT
jgi:effector-binding domain-containing protein